MDFSSRPTWFVPKILASSDGTPSTKPETSSSKPPAPPTPRSSPLSWRNRLGKVARYLAGFILAIIFLALVLSYADPIRGWLATVSEFLPVLVGSILIGVIGSTAYYTALNFGYLGGKDRDELLKTFRPRSRVVWYATIGGLVAAVFQLAQITSFAPVQSFVLGITWPILISQYLAGRGETLLDQITKPK